VTNEHVARQETRLCLRPISCGILFQGTEKRLIYPCGKESKSEETPVYYDEAQFVMYCAEDLEAKVGHIERFTSVTDVVESFQRESMQAMPKVSHIERNWRGTHVAQRNPV
jgi:hypothetical protein